ncbi:thiol:disulfide interchange protein DsbA/DsbL [Usitatibacter palustris]|uniref:Thiol:disulfide interchange protein n=1 Tax=Usitatibacter palustris TaxID=2732487 RepID=A0A6M4HB65_9PROT|nr:thiol:disulfide interchange protein DsbA/DsbL [Usitatibacter palustris]QJR16930.1 Thiol:disulfide interchange protein DsbA [Usitatibacter palustris]
MSLRKILAIALGAFAFSAGTAIAQTEYTVLNPSQPTEGGDKVEVTEFFWYGCGHCYKLEPFVEKWAANLPKDVVFKRVPAIPNEGWKQTAVIFYTLEAMGQLDKMHKKVFDAIHQDNVILTNRKVRDEWLAKQGVDVAKFLEVEKSFSVVTKLNRAAQMTAAYKVDGVPMIFVNGKYMTSNSLTKGDNARVFAVVDELVALSRKENAAAAAPASASATKPAGVKK